MVKKEFCKFHSVTGNQMEGHLVYAENIKMSGLSVQFLVERT